MAFATEPYHRVFSRLRGVIPHPTKQGYWKAFCPYHKGGQERNRSLSLWLGSDGKLLISCWACGRQLKKEILASMGLKMSDLFPESEREDRGDWWKQDSVRPKVVEFYDYTDEMGVTIFRVNRFEPKGFTQEVWDGQKFRPGLQNCRRVPYRLKDLIDPANKSRGVLIVEGERKVNLLYSLGFVATCNPGGAGMGWRDEYSTFLSGRNVRVLPDNNEVGRRHADSVAGSCIRFGAQSVGMIFLQGLPEGGDIIDWHKAGGTAEQLMEMIVCSTFYSTSR